MTTLKLDRILATTDFSPFSNSAVDYAHRLAERFGSELHVLHVARTLEEIQSQHGMAAILDKGEGEDAPNAWLHEILGEAGNVRRVQAVRLGDNIAETICKYVKENSIELIVLASHGRTGLSHLLMGSVAERVLHCSPCPVLITKGQK